MVTWFSIRLLIIISEIRIWLTLQVDFVLAYPQSPTENDLYMKFPKETEKMTGNGKTHVMKFILNLYVKKAGRVWNKYLTNKLLTIRFEKSAIGN